METKLIKTEVNYLLENEEGAIIASTSIKKGISSLSKENCDELFGVIDVELMADFYGASVKGSLDFKFGANKGFIDGFNKAMELNKKVFTATNLRVGMIQLISLEKEKGEFHEVFKERQFRLMDNYLKHLLQPTEIDVEVVEQCLDPTCDGINRKGKCVTTGKPKYDTDGCLILKIK